MLSIVVTFILTPDGDDLHEPILGDLLRDVADVGGGEVDPEANILFLKHESRIPGQSSNLVCGFSMMEQVRLCAVRPTENWLGTSKTTYRV